MDKRVVAEVSTGMSSDGGRSTDRVFRRLSLEDEPSAFGTYTASDAAGKLPYSREGLLVALVSVVWGMHRMGQRNSNGYGNTRWIHHDLLSLCHKILPHKSLIENSGFVVVCASVAPTRLRSRNSTLETIQRDICDTEACISTR